jgi:CzcA family heavy metal efflux pump
VSFYALLRRHAAVVWLATAMLAALGIACAAAMPSGIYPEVEFPRILVVARLGGAPAEVYLTSITRPLEQALTAVLGVERIRSKTIRGASEISLQFAPDTDMQRALQMVEARVSQERSHLPPDTDIVVERLTTGSFPILTLNVAGATDPRELRELAEFIVRPALANVAGVGRVEVVGGDVREFEIILRPEVTAGLQLTPRDVADRIRTAMGLRAVGRVERDRQIVTVMGDAQPRTLAEIRDLPVALAPDGVAIPVGDVAEVVEGHEDRVIRVGGPHGEAVGISVARQPGASTTDVVDRALAAIAALGPSLPRGVTIDAVYDQASLVRESMISVRDAILVGVALCAAVIALFLGDWRAGLLAATAVPITLAVTLALMRAAHQTLNLMSLGGMAVAIGLVVDDAIVVIEAIARHRDGGFAASSAATTGSIELAPAVVGTTLTTVVVFVPLAFLPGVVGDFFRALAFTVTAAVLVSLAIALVLVPLAAGIALPPLARPRGLGRLGARYGFLVRRLVRYPVVAGVAYAIVLASGVVAAAHVKRGFLPTMDEGAFVLDYFLPSGTSLAVTESFARKIEAELVATADVQSFTRRTGAELGPAAATETNRGDIMVRLAPRAQRARAVDDVIADVRARLERSLPEVRVEFVQVLQDMVNDLSGSPRPIEVKIFGRDYGQLHQVGDAIAAKLRRVPDLVDVYDGRERDSPELRFVADREAMARLGATSDEVHSQLETALLGAQVGALRYFDRLVGVRVRYPDPFRFREDKVLDLPFVAKGVATTLRSVTEARSAASPSQLMHEALQPMVDVTADCEHRDLGSVSDDVDAILAKTPLPPGVRVVLGGQIAGQRTTVRELATLAGVSVLLVLTVLAAQFRRLRLAALVLASVPMALVGALLALLATGTPLNASSLMGCVLLVGLVVKNGVLLLEGAERLANAGTRGDIAVAAASDRRVRPVVMTTLATLAGLTPLALGIGPGAELQRPLAVAVIGGLVTSTIATLGLLPPFAARALGGAREPRRPPAPSTSRM